MAWTICPSPSLGEKGTGVDVDIKLYDANLEIYGKPIDTFSSLTYTDRWNADGDFKLVLPVEKYNDVKDAAYIFVDGRMFEIATINTKDASANNQLSLSGHNLNVLLSRVVISTPSRIQGKLETEIRTLVDSLCGSTSWQAIDKFTLGTLHGYARAMDANAMRGSLSDFLYTELNKRGFSFSLTYDDVNDEIVFDIIQSLDRTQDQTDNAFATFSASLGNVQNIEYERNKTDYYNCAVVCDEAETDPQTVIVDLSNGEPKRTIYVSGTSAGADDSEATNMYVMVGQYSPGVGFIASSTDGVTFTSRVTSGYGALWAVDYQNGMFIVCGDGGVILTSTDAITWTPQTSGVAVALEGALYYDGMYLATGNSSNILRSYNKTTWTIQNTGGAKIVSPIWSGSRFLSFGAGGYYYRSYDYAETWSFTRFDVTGGSFSSQNCAVAGDRLIVSGYIYRSGTFTPAVIYSDDEFDTYTIVELSALTGQRFLDVAYGNGVLVSIGQTNMIMWSDDGGETWTDCTPAGGTPDYITVCFNETDGTFHAYSFTGKYHAYSSDGKNWTLSTFTASVEGVDAVVYGTSSHTMSLYDIGYNALQSYKPIEIIDGEILPNTHPILGTECKVGDIVDVIDQSRGIIMSVPLAEAQTIYEPKRSVIIPKFGENYLSLKKYIEKVVDRLV